MQNYLRAQAKLETAWKQVSNKFLVGIISHIWFSLLSTKNIFLWQLYVYQIQYISGFGIQTWDNLDHRGNYASAVISFEKRFCQIIVLASFCLKLGLSGRESTITVAPVLFPHVPLASEIHSFKNAFLKNFCPWGNCLAQLSGALH